MPTPKKAPAASPFDLAGALIQAFATNQRINEYMLEALAPAAWDVKPPEGAGRTIAAIVAHIHNVRLMWLKAVAPGEPLPEKLDRGTVSIEEAKEALRLSCTPLAAVLDRALHGDGQVRGFKPDAAGFFAYLITHEAHHRGQIASLARRLGHPLPQQVQFGLWEWGSRSKECA
jgi:uncharacterized damage-inducible protein DinB